MSELKLFFFCRIYLKCSDRQTCANSEDPDQTPQNAASDQGLHCLTLIQQVFDFYVSLIRTYDVPIYRASR